MPVSKLMSSGSDDAEALRRLRLLAQSRCQQLTDHLVATGGRAVRSGPFAGMWLLDRAEEGCYLPKLLGCYEMELHPWIEYARLHGYAEIVNVGCSEGYYATGMARLLPTALVTAHDRRLVARNACHRMAVLNGVSNRIQIETAFPPSGHYTPRRHPALLICDVEGAEATLLSPRRIPALNRMDMIVEVHEQLIPGLVSELAGRFSHTHEAAIASVVPRMWVNFSELAEWNELDRLLAVWEWRSGPTPWLFLRQRGHDARQRRRA